MSTCTTGTWGFWLSSSVALRTMLIALASPSIIMGAAEGVALGLSTFWMSACISALEWKAFTCLAIPSISQIQPTYKQKSTGLYTRWVSSVLQLFRSHHHKQQQQAAVQEELDSTATTALGYTWSSSRSCSTNGQHYLQH